jgi:antitoxin ChpS
MVEAMTAKSRTRRKGGAAVMTIPAALLKVLGWKAGTQVALSVTDGELVARPLTAPRGRYSLSELLEGSELVAGLNAATAWSREGEPVGGEMA